MIDQLNRSSQKLITFLTVSADKNLDMIAYLAISPQGITQNYPIFHRADVAHRAGVVMSS
jgi:hypothetical protein